MLEIKNLKAQVVDSDDLILKGINLSIDSMPLTLHMCQAELADVEILLFSYL